MLNSGYMTPKESGDGYIYEDARRNDSHKYLLPAVASVLRKLNLPTERKRIFELGCGNGATAAFLNTLGFDVVGVDPSAQGIALGRAAYPELRLEVGDCYLELAAIYGRFPIVLSLEVVEHVFLPREFARRVYDLLEDGGVAIISTPFHGYWKNLAMAVTGKMDAHFTALWDYGHIKFWSEKTLGILLRDAGFRSVRYQRIGRIGPLAKSMIAIAAK
jgi:2-polyprenyl-6-hydroxyphenyl methylase/3-demethylubiquinone-9 3-methyltransferase